MVLLIYSEDSFNSCIQQRITLMYSSWRSFMKVFFFLYYPLSHPNTIHSSFTRHISMLTSLLGSLSSRKWGHNKARSICSLTPAVYLDYRNIDRPSLTGSAWLRNTGWCSRLTKKTCEMRLHCSNFCQHWHGMAWQRHSRRVRLVATTDSAFQACKKKHRSESVGKITIIIIFNPV